MGQPEKAIEAYKALDIEPNNFEFHNNAGAALKDLNKTEDLLLLMKSTIFKF